MKDKEEYKIKESKVEKNRTVCMENELNNIIDCITYKGDTYNTLYLWSEIIYER